MTKTTKKSSQAAQFNMSATAAADLSSDDAVLAAMLGGISDNSDEIIVGGGDSDEGLSLTGDADETAIQAAVAEIEKAEANHAVYAEAGAPEAGAADTPQPAAAAKPAKKLKVKAAPKAPKADAAPKEPKPAPVPRVTYVGHTKSEVLMSKLGDKASEFLLLEVADVSLDADTLKAKQDALLADIDKLAKKVGEKANMLFGWLRKGGKLNEVMERSLRVLAKAGELTSGDKGNLQTNLLEKYSVGTARSQANQMFMLFPALAITTKEKGRMIANPNSLILMKAKAELGLE